MRKLVIACAAATIVFSAGNAGYAADKLTKNSIVEFMINSVDLGASRGICIGTAEECAQPTQTQGLDMLINFELSSATLTPEAQANLDVFSEALKDKRLARAKFVVEGHTDARGTDFYNEDLAKRRAGSVVRYLTQHGVEESRLVSLSKGERSPRTDDPFDPENRRVEMRISLK